MADAILQRAVLDELNWTPQVEAGHIGVTVHGGVVTLTGHVEHYLQKRAAEQAAGRVRGVADVANEIEVCLADNRPNNDETIAERAAHVLAWDSAISKQNIKVAVSSGWVELAGIVDWAFQREAAEHDVHKIHGVVGISNLITVRPRATTGEIHQQITAALKRHAELDAATITVSAQDGRVVLDGNVKSLLERQLAEQTAWSAPGVTHVNDLVTVN